MLGCCRRLAGWAETLPAAACLLGRAASCCRLLPCCKLTRLTAGILPTHLQAEAVRLARQASNKGFFS